MRFSYNSPIPAIVELVLTALASPSLKEVFLEFNFGYISKLDEGSTWLPIIPLVAKCSSLFIPVYISENVPSAAICEELIPYVQKGVVVMIPTN
jgi:hypothetical protein